MGARRRSLSRWAGIAVMRIAVFAGSSPGRDRAYAQAARDLGALLARRSIGIVYGGGGVGLMGVLADAVVAHGGEVVGVIPQHLVDREIARDDLADLKIVGSMHERKMLMSDLADAFIALPGGAGTLDELFEIWTWAQLGLHRKAIGLLNVKGFFTKLDDYLAHLVREGFLAAEHKDMVALERDPGRLLERLLNYSPPPSKWSTAPPRRA